MSALDLRVLQWFNQLGGHSSGFDAVVAFFTNYAPLLFAALFAFYFVRRSRHSAQMRKVILLSGFSGVIAVVITAIVGHLVYRARPFVALPPGQIHLLIPHPPDSSFPSDHTMGSAAFAAGMWHAPGRWVRWLFLTAALLVGASRLVAGVHWPSDVLFSFILGGAVAQGTFALQGLLAPVLDGILHVYGRAERRIRPQAGD